MAKSANQNSFSLLDMSGGMQTATSRILKKRIEVANSKNAAFNIRIGSACRRFGYEQLGQTIQYGQDSLYGGIYSYNVTNNRIISGINNAAGTNATLNFLDVGGYWTPILTNAAPNTHFQCLNYLDEFYVAGKAPGGAYQPLTAINSQMQIDPANTMFAPACKFVAQFGGQLYAMNCQVNGVTYANRAYFSSGATGVVTQINTAINGWTNQLSVSSVRYLKVGMGIDIYGSQTSNQKYSNLVITSVDKVGNNIGFSGQTINVNADDEIWITGRFGMLTTLWNTDYPTAETSDWISVPSGEDEIAEFTGWTVNNNRLFLYTKNSLLKWDGTNLILISQSVGAVSHESIKNIGSWTLWLHQTGVWGYNDTTGQLKMISRAITPTIDLINPGNLKYASAVVSNRTYKLAVGQLMNTQVPDTLYLQTTSTSTSSTSTSSTSTSTSSTSTSSTSTSTIPPIISGVAFSTSTSSTSSSTSSTSSSSTSTSSTSTSISSTSSSTSTSTTASSTTTQPTGKKITRLCYDFDLNIWWREEHTRELRFQFMHTMNGYTKPYFTDENGYMFRDETGLTDAGQSIPMEVEFGKNNCGIEQNKVFSAMQIDSERSRTGIIQYSLDGGPWTTLGEIKSDVETLNVPQKSPALATGHNINVRFMHNSYSDPPFLNGWILYFNVIESIVNELGVSL